MLGHLPARYRAFRELFEPIILLQQHFMRILAIETVGLSGSVAALESDRLIALRDLDPSMRSAQSLTPTILELLAVVGWQPENAELVAVATGPGSFTGLRVGVTTAKMFAYAVKADLLGINTLEAIAWQAIAQSNRLYTVLDALRNQVFVGKFSRESNGPWQWNGETQLLDNDTWIAKVFHDTAVSGPGLAKLLARIPPGSEIVDADRWSPKANSVGQLAWRHYKSGSRHDVFSLVPQYFRPSAAEEKKSLLRQQQNQQQQ
jgi:tRNA threonylcarbamoyladenosine biosynthesis protein TsaB